MKSVVAGMAAVALIAGCGSSTSSKTSSGGSGTPSSGGSSAKGPIKILTYGDIIGVAPTPQHQFQDGVQAAVNAFNASGGVQGRKVQLITCDTKLNPALASTCVEKASSEGVVAAVPSLELLDNVTTPLLEKEGIPLLGSDPSTAAAQYSKTSACFLPGPYVLYPVATTYLAHEGAKSISLLEPAGVANENILNQASTMAAQAEGAKVPASVQVPGTASNFSPIAAQATGAGETGSFISANPPGLFSLLGDVAQTRPGIKLAGPGYIIVDPQILGAFTKIPPTKGMFIANYTAFPTDSSVPGIKLFQQQIASVNKSDLGNESALFPWLDAWGAMQILKTMTSGPITPSTVLAAMKKATLNFEGVVPNWHYQYNTLGLGCANNNEVYEGVYKGGVAVTPLNGDKPTTGVSPQIVAFYKKALAAAAG